MIGVNLMGNIYSLVGESNDPNIKKLPKHTLTCEEFDDFTNNNFLVLPNAAFSLYDSPDFKEKIKNVASKHQSKEEWWVLGSLGDYSSFKSMGKNGVKLIDTMHGISVQKRITKPTISKVRKDVCGKPLEE